MKTSHAVTVLGRELSVRSSAPEFKVRAVETFVNGKLQEIGSSLKNGDAQLVLSLALLNTAEELLGGVADRFGEDPCGHHDHG